MTPCILCLNLALAVIAHLCVHAERAPLHAPGYMHCARTHVRLDEVLDTIRDNLRREQKTVMELNSAPHLPVPATVTGRDRRAAGFAAFSHQLVY